MNFGYKIKAFFENAARKTAAFMYGRYGTDNLNKFMIYLCLALIILNILFRSAVISLVETILLLLTILRSFSKNFTARRKENSVYLKIKTPTVSFFKLQINRIKDRKTHAYRKCPHCKAILRLPRRKGKHTASCPKCGNKFDVRIF